MRLDQIQLVSVITKEVCRQFKEAGENEPLAVTYQFQAVIDAANLVVAAYEREPMKAAPGSGVEAWLASDDRGLSSESICRRLFGKPPIKTSLDRQNSHPRDPDDFGRCHRFLQVVPEARAKLDLMKDVSHVWKRLVEQWDALTYLYLKELPSGNAPLLYKHMKELGC